jgi:hypothetical protein
VLHSSFPKVMRIKSRIRTSVAIMPPAPKTCSVLEHRGRDRWGQCCERDLRGFWAGCGCCTPESRIVGAFVQGVQADTRQDIDTGGPVIARQVGREIPAVGLPAPATSHAATSRGSPRQVYRVRESKQFSAVTDRQSNCKPVRGNAQIMRTGGLLGFSRSLTALLSKVATTRAASAGSGQRRAKRSRWESWMGKP